MAERIWTLPFERQSPPTERVKTPTFADSLKPEIRDSDLTAIREAAQHVAFTEMRSHPGSWDESLRSAISAVFDFLTVPHA